MLIASIAMQVVLSVVCQPKAEALPQEYRSSQLGFSIRYPEGWEKGRGGMDCGNSYMDLDEAGLRRAEIHPVSLASGVKGGGGMSVGFRREADAPVQGAPSDPKVPASQPFDMRSSLKATKSTKFNDWYDPTMERKYWSADYTIWHEGRLVRLSGSCLIERRAECEPVFDAMARSLSMFEPTEDRRKDDGVKTYLAPRFKFEYPGSWIVVGAPYDDEEAAKSMDHGYLRGPKDIGVVHGVGEPGQSLQFYQSAARGGASLGLDDTVNLICHGYRQEATKRKMNIATTDFVTSTGIKGKRIVVIDPLATKRLKEQEKEIKQWAKENGKPVPPLHGGDCSVYYVMPLDGQSAEVFTDALSATKNMDESLARYDAIVRSFKVIRRPGEPEPVVPLSH